MSNITGWQLQNVWKGMLWDMPFVELVRRAGVTAQEWLDMEGDCVPVPEGFWDLLMNLVNRWDEEQRSRSTFN